jgi:hypothetical protein
MSPTYVANEFPDDLKNQILAIIGDRLNTGEVLLSESQFVAAMEEGSIPFPGPPWMRVRSRSWPKSCAR